MLITEVKVDPRVKRTRQLLQDALDDLLSEKSFNQITVQDITERAGLNRATFYAHFEDKYALLNHSVREGFQAILDKNLPESPTFTPENLRRLILSVCEYLGGFAGHCAPISVPSTEQLMMVLQVQVYLDEVLLQWLNQAAKNTQKTASLPNVVARMISWTVFGAVSQWSRGGRKISRRKTHRSGTCRTDRWIGWVF